MYSNCHSAYMSTMRSCFAFPAMVRFAEVRRVAPWRRKWRESCRRRLPRAGGARHYGAPTGGQQEPNGFSIWLLSRSLPCSLLVRIPSKTQLAKMMNTEGATVDLYIPRKWCELKYCSQI
jgi:hypothetical protein